MQQSENKWWVLDILVKHHVLWSVTYISYLSPKINEFVLIHIHTSRTHFFTSIQSLYIHTWLLLKTTLLSNMMYIMHGVVAQTMCIKTEVILNKNIMLTLKKSSWWTTQQFGSDLISLLVKVVLPPLVTLDKKMWSRIAGKKLDKKLDKISVIYCLVTILFNVSTFSQTPPHSLIVIFLEKIKC